MQTPSVCPIPIRAALRPVVSVRYIGHRMGNLYAKPPRRRIDLGLAITPALVRDLPRIQSKNHYPMRLLGVGARLDLDRCLNTGILGCQVPAMPFIDSPEDA